VIQSKKILCIDCVNLLGNLKAHLETNDCSVDVAKSGREALTKITVQQYDLILTESRLSDMECPDLVRRIQNETPDTVTMIVTDHPNLRNVIASLNLGVDAYFRFPFDSEQLVATIEKKLTEREERGKIDQEKVTDMVKTRIRMLSQQE
jgi:DNA-binding NtrC family response regulator